jgi:hypothetical protein
VALTLEVSFQIKVDIRFGFDASGVHDLVADGFKGAGDANNWGACGE